MSARGYLMLSANISPSGAPTGFMFELAAWLGRRPDNSLVLLVDEYDSPLARFFYDERSLPGIQTVLSAFFNVVKAKDACFRFIFLTGGTRLGNTGVFSGLNNLTDISLDSRYGTLLGYTEAELHQYFGGHLAVAADALQISAADLVERLKTYYGGFSFDIDGESHVFCPWSVLNFLSSARYQFDNYWFQSGGQPLVLMNFLKKRRLETPLDFLDTVPMDSSRLLSSAPYDKLDVNVLLYQTGYLTIRSVDIGGDLLLGYPNREVAASMALLYAKVMVEDDEFTPNALLKNLLTGDVENAVAFINQVFLALDYQRYPIRDEASFQGCMQILMIGMSLRPQIEVHTARGRSDMEVDAGSLHWVFEFKFAKTGVDPQVLCQEAVDQIKMRRYGSTLHGKQLIRVAMVFDEEKRQITAWERLPVDAVTL